MALAAGFDCEIDLQFRHDQLWLGHDKPQQLASPLNLQDPRLWCHAKDELALHRLLLEGTNCFAHNEDNYVLTSDKFIWYYTGCDIPPSRAILVLPETAATRLNLRCRDLKKYAGVCTDFPYRYKTQLDA